MSEVISISLTNHKYVICCTFEKNMVAKMRDINFRLSKMIDTDDSGNSVIFATDNDGRVEYIKDDQDHVYEKFISLKGAFDTTNCICVETNSTDSVIEAVYKAGALRHKEFPAKLGKFTTVTKAKVLYVLVYEW